MEIETFTDIPGFESHYQISQFGNVKSFKYKKPKILKTALNLRGYLHVSLSLHNIRCTKLIHQLMAITYLNHKPCNHEIIVDHIDNNKLNNRLSNLQLISQRENSSKDKFKKQKTSQYTGVYWNKRCKKWHSTYNIKNKHLSLGYFDNEIDASNAYKNKIKTLNYVNS